MLGIVFLCIGLIKMLTCDNYLTCIQVVFLTYSYKFVVGKVKITKFFPTFCHNCNVAKCDW